MTDYKTLQNLLSSRHIPFHTVTLKSEKISVPIRLEVYDSKLLLRTSAILIQDLFSTYDTVKVTEKVDMESIWIELKK